jgi:hypothetical protein
MALKIPAAAFFCSVSGTVINPNPNNIPKSSKNFAQGYRQESNK